MKSIILFLLASFAITTGIYAQPERSHAHMVSLNFQQIDESLNYGLVFRGPGAGYSYFASWQAERSKLIYEGRFGFNIPMTRDIIAASLNLVPVRLDYLLRLGQEKKFSLGPYFIADYNYEIYPDLQSGYTYWFTNLSLGAGMEYSFSIKKSSMNLLLHTTVMGLTSRTPEYENPYFFDDGLDEMVKDMHQDMQFGSFGQYNVTELEVRWKPRGDSRLAYAYLFQFYGYFDQPEWMVINQSVKLMILPKKDK